MQLIINYAFNNLCHNRNNRNWSVVGWVNSFPCIFKEWSDSGTHLACVAGGIVRAQSFGLVEEKKPRREWGGDALKSRLPED